MNNDLISSEYVKAKMFDIPKPKEGATFWDGVDTVGDIIDNAPTVEPISIDEYRNKLIGLFHETGHDELITFICLPTETDYKILRDILLQYKFEPQRPQGEWIEKQETPASVSYHCSICNMEDLPITPFCPWCGAKMKGGAENE